MKKTEKGKNTELQIFESDLLFYVERYSEQFGRVPFRIISQQFGKRAKNLGLNLRSFLWESPLFLVSLSKNGSIEVISHGAATSGALDSFLPAEN